MDSLGFFLYSFPNHDIVLEIEVKLLNCRIITNMSALGKLAYSQTWLRQRKCRRGIIKLRNIHHPLHSRVKGCSSSTLDFLIRPIKIILFKMCDNLLKAPYYVIAPRQNWPLHYHSSRSSPQWKTMKFNCAPLPRMLIVSRLSKHTMLIRHPTKTAYIIAKYFSSKH